MRARLSRAPVVPLGINLARNRPPTRGWVWAAVMLALLAAMVTGLQLLRDWNALTEARVARARAVAIPPSAKPAQSRSSDAAVAQDKRVRAALQRMVADLRRPWFELFDRLDMGSERSIHLVQLTVDSEFRRANLQVEAPGMRPVMRYVSRLDSAESPAARARLLSQESMSSTPGRAASTTARIRVGLRTTEGSSPAVLEPSLKLACLGTLSQPQCAWGAEWH